MHVPVASHKPRRCNGGGELYEDVTTTQARGEGVFQFGGNEGSSSNEEGLEALGA